MYHHFSRIFELFRISEPEKSPEPQPQEEKQQANAAEFPKKELNLKKVPKLPDEFDDEDEHVSATLSIFCAGILTKGP